MRLSEKPKELLMTNDSGAIALRHDYQFEPESFLDKLSRLDSGFFGRAFFQNHLVSARCSCNSKEKSLAKS